ncbi:hypothetical protein [Xenorhabdus innexi]|uniref:Peptidase M10 metallopeptidase domain-containing protein n=1 Tax=Xenorhabdus innexi TaxID=290109 RepID=A0A1N6MW81_9GAMM|nr:hypothetical protein [Xenorhabdus innexi]PHM29474.1 hypothetical protein Xinn_03651 [Xenorhabdus innexi]SIP73080.1 exported hypothetical protein [Xenorhabdus innexi]
MRYISLVLLLAIFCAYGYDPASSSNPNRHVCSIAIGNAIYSPAHFFNNNLRYRIDENIGSVTVAIHNSDGTTRNIAIDVAPLVRNAANMWNQRLAARDSPTRLTEAPQGSPSESNFRVSRANGAQQNSLDESNHRRWDFAETTLVLPPEIMQRYSNPIFNQSGMVLTNTFRFSRETFDTIRGAISEYYTENQVAKILVYQTIAHEFGHALGLTHPDALAHEDIINGGKETEYQIDSGDPSNFLAIAITAELERGQLNARVPLMTSNDTYFLRLRNQLGRRLNYEDIEPSQLELSAIDMENACSSPPSYQYKSNAVSSDTCKEKPNIFYPKAQALIPLYQIQLF